MRVGERQAWENGRDYALRVLKENIVNLELKPGSFVSEKDLADELGLSRTPVREALMDLAKVEIVEIYPQRGSQISRINYALVEDNQFTRNILEKAVVQLACRSLKPEDEEILKESLRLQEFYMNKNSDKMMELDDGFHEELFRIAGKLYSYNMLRTFSIHFDRVRRMALHAVKDSRIVEDHWKIYGAVADGDEEGAQELMEQHLARYKVDEKEIRENYPADYFA